MYRPCHPTRDREVGVTARARRQGAISAPETCVLHQTVSRLPVANHIFLGSWIVDITARDQLPRGDTQYP